MIQKLNAEGRLEKKEAKKGIGFDKVRTVLHNHCNCFIEKLELLCGRLNYLDDENCDSNFCWMSPLAF